MYPRDELSAWYQGQGKWQAVPAEDWGSYRWQLRNRITTVKQLEEYVDLTESEREGCKQAKTKLSLAITPYFLNLIDPGDPECPIRKQVIPRREEGVVMPEETWDPIGEETTMPVPTIVHRYVDRVLFLVTDRCASYCRYCTRSRMVSNAQGYGFHSDVEEGLKYIRNTPEVRDVLLSGGDPLLLTDEKLAYLLRELRAIAHVEFIRIGSRVPVFLPQRITSQLCDVFKAYGPVCMSLHFNHPKECTKEVKGACDRLALAGVPLGSQGVLLRGVNDSVDVLKSLFHRQLMMRVRPYYLYHCDAITGSGHFRVPIDQGRALMQQLRESTSGYAVPEYVLDSASPLGKQPLW